MAEKITDYDPKNDKILVTERSDSNLVQNNFNSVLVKAKIKDRKQLILKRLMLFGLKPSLRMAALKMLTCKKKLISFNENEKETEGSYC